MGQLDERLLMWLEWLFRHKGKVLGASVGLLIGWMAIRFGLFRALFVALCLLIGLSIGCSLDKGESPLQGLARIAEWVDRILSHRSSRWRY